MPAEARSRIKGRKAKGLGFGGVDHFPYIDAHGVIDDFEFVHEGDVDGAENILGQLHGLGGMRRRYRNNPIDHRAVERTD